MNSETENSEKVATIPRRIISYWKVFLGIFTPIILLPIPILYESKTASCAYCVLILAIFWMTEAIPIPITALLPVVLYPLFQIADTDTITREYLKDSIMVFVGGLLVALAFEFCQLHKRIALRVMLATGASLTMLMLGTMLTTAFLSMWMFNTATTAMMVPIIQAVLDELQKSLEEVYMNPPNPPSTEIDIDDKIKTEETHELEDETSSGKISSSRSEDEKEEVEDEEISNSIKSETRRMSSIRKNLAGESKHVNLEDSGPDFGKCEENEEVETKLPCDRKVEVENCIRNMRTMFLLSTCYSSNIGGTGVITGSGTNLVALEFLGELDPAHHGPSASLTFATWAAFNFVPMVVNIFVAWVYLQLVFVGFPIKMKFWLSSEAREEAIKGSVFHPELEGKIKIMLARKYKDLGSITLHETAVAICFLVAVTSWILHDPRFIPGWGELFYGGPKVSISTATLLVGVIFFVIPRNREFYTSCLSGDFGTKMEPLLEWEFVQRRFPWGVIILLGGGYALSKGAKSAGLNELIGETLKSLSGLSPSLLQLSCMGMIAFITEVTSNTATASIVIPILLELSKGLDIHPLYLTLPATVTCSYAFMLPVATPPNAIVYAAGNMKVTDMIKTGLFMNVACVLVLYASTNLYGNLFFHFDEYHYIP